MEESRELRAMRQMAWERAKGELRSMLHTHYSCGEGENHRKLSDEIEAFVDRVQLNGLHE